MSASFTSGAAGRINNSLLMLSFMRVRDSVAGATYDQGWIE
jgi:hypothetical protein